MNNKELTEIRFLREKYNNTLENIINLTHFINTYSNYFKDNESINAINRIKDYRQKLSTENIITNNKINKIVNKISKDCPHTIIASKMCPFCNKKFSYTNGDNTKYVIETNYIYDINDIMDLVISSNSYNEATNKILTYYNNLQFSENIKIKRLTNEKE